MPFYNLDKFCTKKLYYATACRGPRHVTRWWCLALKCLSRALDTSVIGTFSPASSLCECFALVCATRASFITRAGMDGSSDTAREN
jgi:hypothetical protein